MAEKMTDQEVVSKLGELVSSGVSRGQIQKAFNFPTMTALYNLTVPAHTRAKKPHPLLPESTLGGGKKPFRVVGKNNALAISKEQMKEMGFKPGEKVNITFAKGGKKFTGEVWKD